MSLFALKRLAAAALGSPPMELSARVATQRRLRVFAYHGIGDLAAFTAQMEHLARRYTAVDVHDVAAALENAGPLPRSAVWVTFDDGSPDVVELAQPVLDRLGIPATMYVCPGLIGTQQPYWWEVVEKALDHGVTMQDLLPSWDGTPPAAHLKTLPDTARREIVEQLKARLQRVGPEVILREQLTEVHLEGWLQAGHTLGNHSWDHPCLDRCEPEEQIRQVERAHSWLEERWPSAIPTFAYPNGDRTHVVERRLEELGYRIAVMFDHRLVARRASPLRVSRVRVDATAPLPRFRALASGAHSGAFHATATLRRKFQERPRPRRPR